MMKWKYYNHAMIPTTAPHEIPDLQVLKDGAIWKIERQKIPLLVRWTTEFDCDNETQWWYVIKDTPFNILDLKAKRRYEINKGKKNFYIKKIVADNYPQEILNVQIASFSDWPEKYRPTVNEQEFVESLEKWNYNVVYGGFDCKTDQLVAYSMVTEYTDYLEFSVLRSNPQFERYGINAAMVAAIVEDYNEKLSKGFYISDGSRSIRHETAFQDYLEKYFGFRKAYCKLNIKYRFPIGIIVSMLYPARNWINKKSKMGSIVCSLLQMEEIRRSFN